MSTTGPGTISPGGVRRVASSAASAGWTDSSCITCSTRERVGDATSLHVDSGRGMQIDLATCFDEALLDGVRVILQVLPFHCASERPTAAVDRLDHRALPARVDHDAHDAIAITTDATARRGQRHTVLQSRSGGSCTTVATFFHQPAPRSRNAAKNTPPFGSEAAARIVTVDIRLPSAWYHVFVIPRCHN